MNIEQEFSDLKQLIRTASEPARTYFESDDTRFDGKPDGSVVTAVDKAIETSLLSYISERFPNDAIVGEEHGSHEGTSGFVWHIDPIDGTDNFLRKIPFCAVSVARLGLDAEDSFGIVYNPITRQMFASLMESGVYENERVRTLTAEPLGETLVFTLGRGRETWMKPASYALQRGFGMTYGKGRAYGSTALELAYVAANRIDAFLTFGLYSYDYAAGLFLVKSAGGAISIMEDGAWQRFEGPLRDLCAEHGQTIFVSHPDIHDEIRDFIGDPRDWAEQ